VARLRFAPPAIPWRLSGNEKDENRFHFIINALQEPVPHKIVGFDEVYSLAMHVTACSDRNKQMPFAIPDTSISACPCPSSFVEYGTLPSKEARIAILPANTITWTLEEAGLG
jgi:hypothetical protein